MKCTFCGAELDDNAVFCTECGRAIESAPAEPAEAIVKTEKNPGKVPGIFAMILGILSIILPMNPVSFVMAIVAVVLGSIAGKKSKVAGHKNAMAKVGKILGIIEIIADVLMTVMMIVGVIALIIISVFFPAVVSSFL